MTINFQSLRTTVLPWVILLFAASNLTLINGSIRAFGTFIAFLHKHYPSLSLSEFNWIGDLYCGICYILVSLSTFVFVYFDEPYKLFHVAGAVLILLAYLTSSVVRNLQWMFLTFSVLLGIGSSIIFALANHVVNDHFHETHPYRSFAMVVMIGCPVISMGFVSTFAVLIQFCGWQKSLLILGIIYFLVTSIVGMFYEPNEKASTDKKGKEITTKLRMNISGSQIVLLVFWCVGRFLMGIVTNGLLYNLTDYLYRNSNDIIESTILVNCLAVGEVTSYLILIMIFVASKKLMKNKFRYLLFVASLVMSTNLFLLEYFSNYTLIQQALCYFIGLCMGPLVSFIQLASEEITRLPNHFVHPVTLTAFGTGTICSPILTSLIAEYFEYRWFFFTQGVVMGIATLLTFITIILLRVFRCKSERILDETEEYSLDSDEDSVH